ncbi:MAG: PD-(D/E)XK nuclease family protein, partial [Bacteroidota bacterium]|nr:PD-(D/E)XK nuclease family protein [Bacteroidota bacterium]
IGQRGFSPSALATWLSCPLDLYFKYVLGIRSPEEVDEKLGSDVLGQAVHRVMELIFEPFIDRAIDPQELRANIQAIEKMLIGHLSARFPLEALRSGHFRLRMEMAAKALAAYLTAEADRCNRSTTIQRSLEIEVSAKLPNGMLIRGRCDRIDERDGIIHILDVKTGSVQNTQVEFKALDRDQITPEKRYGLQLLMYAWAYMMQEPTVRKVRAGIIPLQKASQAGGLL